MAPWNVQTVQHHAPSYKKIEIPRLGDENLVDFEVDEDGTIYVSLTFPPHNGVILILSSGGSLLSRVQTGNFLVRKLAIDANKRIWTTGQLFASSPGRSFLSDVQLRIYSQHGKLLSVPVGGLDINDPSLSVLVAGITDVKFISHARSAVYDFADTKLAAAHTYPFQGPTGIKQVNLETVSVRPQRLIKGVARIDDIEVWYGNMKNSRDTYSNAFIGLTKLTGEALTAEIVLPPEYQSIAGVDHQGNLYAYSKNEGQLVLKKVRIAIDRRAIGRESLPDRRAE